MATLARMHVELIARTDAFLRDMDTANAKITKTAKGFVAAGKAIAAGWVVKEIIQNTAEAEAAFAQLTAAVKSTGQAAGFSAEELREQAAAMQQVSTFSDEAVEHMQAVLLTFTKVKGDNFTRASAAIVDMATRMGTDLKSAALQVGKALQDPVLGATALARAGVQLSDSQKTLIKSLVEVGDVAGAQRIILKELETQFGGSAAAARNTLGGALTALRNAFGDALEMGQTASGGITDAINNIAAFIPKARAVVDGFLQNFSLAMIELAHLWADLGNKIERTVGRALVALGRLAQGAAEWIPGMAELSVKLNSMGNDLVRNTIADTAQLQKYRDEQVNQILGLTQKTKALGVETKTLGTINTETAETTETARKAQEQHAKSLASAAESLREEIIELTKGADALKAYRLEKLIAGKAPPLVTPDELRLLAKQVELFERLANEPLGNQPMATAGLRNAPILELPPVAPWIADVKRGWMDTARDFVKSFSDGIGKLRDSLMGMVEGVFGSKIADGFANAIGMALGPVLGNLVSSLASGVWGWLSGTGDHTLEELDALRRHLPNIGGMPHFSPFGRPSSGEQSMTGRTDTTVPKGIGEKGTAGDVERLQTITSRSATATIEQENRLIAIQSTALLVLRQSRDLLAALLNGGVQVVSRMEPDADRSRVLGGSVVVA